MAGRVFYFDPEGHGASVFLGPTEARLMEIIWKRREASVKKVLFSLGPESQLAYTTVMTVLNRLVDKGLLARHRSGRNFVYSPKIDREQFLGDNVNKVLACLRGNFPRMLNRK